MELYKELYGLIAVALTLAAFTSYIRSIWQGKTNPHVFSWVIWGSTTLVVFFAQWVDGGGPGSWPTAISGVVTLYVAALAYRKRGEITITRSDWFFFIVGMSSIPLWIVTSDPLWAVVIITFVEIVAFIPTIRKAYHAPYGEKLLFYFLMTARNFASAIAMEHYSWTTLLVPVSMVAACSILISVVGARRVILKQQD